MIYTIQPPDSDAPQTGQEQSVFDANASGTLGYLSEFVASWNSNVNFFNNDIESVNNSLISAKDLEKRIEDSYIDEKLTYNASKINKLSSEHYSASGYKKILKKRERFVEGTIPYTIEDISYDSVLIGDVTVERNSSSSILLPVNPTGTVENRKDLVLFTNTGYKVVVGTHFFNANESSDNIAIAYGYSKISNCLYNDGIEDVIIVGLYDRLNDSAYHPVYNESGCRKFSDEMFWYETSDTVTSEEDCISKRSSLLTSGRPDGKVENIAYFEGNGGLIFKPSYTTVINELDLLSTEYSKLVSGDLDMSEELGVETLILGVYNLDSTWSSTSGLLDTNRALRFDNLPYTPLLNLTDKYYRFNISSDTGWQKKATMKNTGEIFVNDYGSAWTVGVSYTVTLVLESKELLAQGTSLLNDIVGDTSNYPQDWIDRISSGKSIAFNPLLVGEEGEDYTDSSYGGDGEILSQIKYSTKVLTTFNNVVRTYDSGSTYSVINEEIDSITNRLTPTSTLEYSTYIVANSSQNKPLSQATPLPIKQVMSKTVASNSHSIYKGGMITNSVTGKVSVGDGTNGLESKTLENVVLSNDGSVQTIPSHQAIILDAELSPTSKSFCTLAVDTNDEYILQVFGEELVGTTGDNGEFDNQSNSIFTDLNGIPCKSFIGIKRLGVFSK